MCTITSVVFSSDTNNDVTGQIDVRTGSEPTVGFCELNQYMGVNDHLKGLDHGKHAPKTAVEERISEAVARGDIARAEQLSDHLATREVSQLHFLLFVVDGMILLIVILTLDIPWLKIT